MISITECFVKNSTSNSRNQRKMFVTHVKNIITKEISLEQEKHLQDKDIWRVIKHNAKDEALRDLNFAVAAFDLEKVLLTPHEQTSSFYYSRRLSNHNFAVTELDNMSTWCFL